MNILYYTSGTTGSGRVVQGISIGNALKRKNFHCEYTIASSSRFAYLADRFEIPHIEIPEENENELSEREYSNSMLYQTLCNLKPDYLLVDLQWFTLYHFINELSCTKIFLCRQITDRFFTIPLPDGEITFRPDDYDLILRTEPFENSIPMESINPIVIRNRNEILTREEALEQLGLDDSMKACLFAYNGKPGEYERIKKIYSYIEDTCYQMVYSTNYEGGLFPAVDYFNAFDMLISGAGYNSFWEAVYFRKEAIFVPVPTQFEDQRLRVEKLQEYSFNENGADQLVDIIMNL